MNRSTLKLTVAAVLTCCAVAQAQQKPTTAPSSTQPTQSSGTIRGRVSVSGSSLSIQRADLSRVVVYLASDPALDVQAEPMPRQEMSQKNKIFTPSFLVVAKGTEVEFPNWDNFDHNVFSRSAAAPAFDLDRYPYGQSKSRLFDKIGVVQVFCNIHPQMRAVVFVAPNRFCTRADAKGEFQISNVPPGNYQIVAWQERCEEQRQSITVSADKPAELEIALHESRERVIDSSNNQKGSYGVERGLGVKRDPLGLPVVRDSHPATRGSE